MAAVELPRCQRHPTAVAGWVCQSCSGQLCPDCVATQALSLRTELDSCTLCGGTTRQLKVHRSRLGLWQRVPGALKFPLTPAGIASLVVVAAFPALLGTLFWSFPVLGKFVGFAFWAVTFWSTMFHIIRLSARGEEDISTPDFSEFFSDVILPAVRGVVATGFIWVPATVYISKRYGLETIFKPGPLLWDPVLWGLGVLGVLYAPMALLVGAAGGGLGRILNPVVIYAYIRRIPRDYFTAVGVLAALMGLRALMGLLSLFVVQIPVPLIAPWVAEILELYPAFVMARVLGLLLHLHGDALDYGMTEDYLEPVLKDEPRGSLTLTGAPRKDLDKSHPAAPTAAVATTGIATTLEEVKKSVDNNDVDRAVELYMGAPQFAPHHLPPAYHFAVGQGAATRGNYPLAVRALTAASETDPSDPIAPRAFVVLARVYGERMNDARKANAIYQFVIERYPGTSAAQFALTRMSPVKA